jgi:hypothetical protein
MYILGTTQSRMPSTVLAIFMNEQQLAIFMNEQQSVEDYGHCIIRIRMCVIFIFGES